MRFLRTIPLLLICAGAVLPSGTATAADLSFMLGITIINDFESDNYPAWSIDYHQPLSKHIDWSVTYLNEGHPPGLRRDGLASELWGYRSFYQDRLVLALGGGVYGFADTRDTGGAHQNEHGVAGLVTFTFRSRLTEKLFLRGICHRVVTSNDTDTDVLLIGLGIWLDHRTMPPP